MYASGISGGRAAAEATSVMHDPRVGSVGSEC
jgi:cobalamin synthase